MTIKETRRATENVAQIPGIAEQQFFLFVKKKLPTATITYEPEEFSSADGLKSTRPDFKIIKDNGSIIYVEITTHPRPTIVNKNGVNITPGVSKDLKEKQKTIMRGMGEKYVVLYRENLLSIQKHNPGEVDFWEARKITDNHNGLNHRRRGMP